MNKLRLLITQTCLRHCASCQNQYWNLSELPIITDYSKYRKIFITGGEPLLCSEELLLRIVKEIRDNSDAKIYFYTSLPAKHSKIINLLRVTNGMTVTPHDIDDMIRIKHLAMVIDKAGIPKTTSLRINLFEEFKSHKELLGVNPYRWVIHDKTWKHEKILPEGEVFGQYMKINY